MWKNLPDLRNVRKQFSFLLFFASLFSAGNFLPAQSLLSVTDGIRWYRSNSSGITIELIPSRRAALRNEFCLSVERADPGLIPRVLVSHYDDTFTAELRVLYEKGRENRRQWVFRDENGLVRLSSSGSPGFFAEKNIPVIDPAKETAGDE